MSALIHAAALDHYTRDESFRERIDALCAAHGEENRRALMVHEYLHVIVPRISSARDAWNLACDGVIEAVTAAPPRAYELYDLRTRRVVATYKSAVRARRRRDKLDNEYGAYRYQVRPVYVVESAS